MRCSDYPDVANWIAGQFTQKVNVDRTVVTQVSKRQ
jgi:hypothetical protein